MKFNHIKFIVEDELAIIQFNRPEVMNCVSPATHQELLVAWNEFKTNDALKVAIITGAGDKAFCSGGDLKAAMNGDFLESWTSDEIALHIDGKRDGILGPTRWTDIYKPILAAVNGVAYAGGLEWACLADIRIAEEHASFGVTCRRWNIGLGDGGTQRLPRIIGLGRAMDMILTGKVIDAKEALAIGLANEVVPKGQSLSRAIEIGRYLCSLPQPAMLTDKEAVYRGLGQPLTEGLKIEAGCFFKSIQSPETQIGLSEFNNRTHPDRSGDHQPKTPGLIRKQHDN